MHRGSKTGSTYADEMRKAGLTPRAELVEVGATVPPAEIAETLGLGESDQTLTRRRHMYADDTPVQVAISYIPMRFAGTVDLAMPDTGPSGIYDRLAQRGYGPVRFVEDIEVRLPTQQEATFLRIAEGQPVFEVLRTAFDADDRPVETCTNVLAAFQWRLTYSWRQEP
jgi:GntR family transcriptional regulator